MRATLRTRTFESRFITCESVGARRMTSGEFSTAERLTIAPMFRPPSDDGTMPE